ncbi:putative spermidine/putrescine transport system permease abc transporter protein [Oceanicola granulosus HTCC2516]|uniref:Putative spermidine/putrescine transport system permease abc transporter protein n=1 Tax=Oceanicola granulosus (strain ATCC BAA-861 / DSM 15982 / KCTC 12143 / HTCC2516) TaxID=314256 RepID=Q2CC46_OCEGH|nr:ABC transporter permease [Oceanicola granulosus]EAR50235.1 putative spermidine/putrescine transport system permease abc transporter protein [Oceanicola granulosus HTCC2516]
MSRTLRTAYIVLVLALLAAPLLVVAGVSINEQQSLRFPPEGLSLRWYGELFRTPDWLGALTNSLVIAAVSSLLAVIVALPLALHVWARQGWLSRGLYMLGVAPFMLPPVISALGFLVFWVSVGMYGQMTATIVSHGIFLVTLPVVTITLGLQSVDLSLIEAARTMGANRGKVLRTVILPLIFPYMVSGYAFAFVLSLNEYIIAYMVAGFTVETLPIKIFNSLRYGYTPIMGVVSVLFVALAALVFGLIGRFGNLPRLLGAERVDT